MLRVCVIQINVNVCYFEYFYTYTVRRIIKYNLTVQTKLGNKPFAFVFLIKLIWLDILYL